MLLTTGYELDQSELTPSPKIVFRDYIPHLSILPHASVVVTHGGLGTVMAAFACGVPSICIPIGRDQHVNAKRVQELDAGTLLPTDARSAEIRRAVTEVVDDPSLRAGAQRMAATLHTYKRGRMAIQELEDLLSTA